MTIPITFFAPVTITIIIWAVIVVAMTIAIIMPVIAVTVSVAVAAMPTTGQDNLWCFVLHDGVGRRH